MTHEEVLNEIQDISASLRNFPLPKEGALIAEKLTELAGYQARLPEIVAEAEYLLNYGKAKISNTIEYFDKTMTPTRIKTIIESETINEQKTYRYAERLNAAIVHLIDVARSQLSYLKSLND